MNYKYIFLSAALCALTASCSESLLDLSPKTNNVLNNYYKNEEQINKGVNAAYACLQYSGQYGIANHVLGELPSDNTWDEVPANDGGNYGQLDEFNMTSSNTIIADSWKHNYIGIQQCNIILNRVDGVDMTENNRSVVKGEIKFLRALMYFNLVRIFGDVPLVTKETENVNDYFGQGRTNKSEVYQQIISDLKEATEMLPLTASLQGHATKGAAEGLLGKVYLTMGNYSEAKIELLKVVNSGQYALLDDPNDIFDTENEGNREIIFDVQYQSGLNGNSEGSNAFMMFSPSGSVSGAKGHNLPTREVYNLFADNDKRKTAYFRLTEVHVATNKLKQTSNVVKDSGSNVVVLRYADVLLMLAECYAQTGDIEAALTCLNDVKSRAGIDEVEISDSNALLDEIALERRKELVCEGHRWFDLIRTGKAIEVMKAHFANTTGYNGVSLNENNLVQPVPLSQIDTDSSIKQNKGYI